MAAVLGNQDYLGELTGRSDVPQAAAVIMQYTGYTDTSKADAPTYACVGTSDGIGQAEKAGDSHRVSQIPGFISWIWHRNWNGGGGLDQ